MAGSSLRNSLHRRNHKERSQLAHRAKFGILEKHKDYVKRARDYHSKQDRLTRLRQKAAERNKDEFYFGMNNEKTKGGVHIKDRGNAALPTDIIKVLKTQDENYVRTMRLANLKKIDKLKAQLTTLAEILKPTLLHQEGSFEDALDDEELEVLQEAGIILTRSRTKSSRRKPAAKHIVFVDDAKEARQYSPPEIIPEQSSTSTKKDNSDSPDIDLGWKVPETKRTKKKRHSTAAAQAVSSDLADDFSPDDDPENVSDTKRRLLKELSARLARDKQMRYAQRELEMQRLMMGKGARTKIQGVEKIEGDSEDEEDEDEIDARRGNAPKPRRVDEATYKPRVYKWRMERKR